MNNDVSTTQPTVTDAQRKKAAQVVDAYNKQAAALAVIVLQLWSLRAEMGEVGAGQVMISGAGWSRNALEVIPMLRVEGKDYPTEFPAGMLIDLRKQASGLHFEAGKQASFAMPEWYTATAESLLLHKAALDYAEQTGVDYITAAITIERGIK